MGPIRAETEIDLPREEVFATIGDMSLRSSFTDHFLSDFHLTRLEPRGVGAGARFRVQAPLRKVWMDSAIVSQDEPFQIVEEGFGGRTNRIRCRTIWELKQGAGSLTHVTVSFWTEPTNPLDRALEVASAGSFWQERGWREALRRLRDMLESDLPGAARIAVAGGNRYTTGIP